MAVRARTVPMSVRPIRVHSFPISLATFGSIKPGVSSSCRVLSTTCRLVTGPWLTPSAPRSLSVASVNRTPRASVIPTASWAARSVALCNSRTSPGVPVTTSRSKVPLLGVHLSMCSVPPAALGSSFYVASATSGVALPGSQNGVAGKLAIGAITDAVYGGFGTPLQTGVQLTRGLGIRGAYNHNWTPEWSQSLFGGFQPAELRRRREERVVRGLFENDTERRTVAG